MKDNFSHNAHNYSRYRPVYPQELYDFLNGLVPAHQQAWDAGTGNGQVATELARYFAKVLATDISSKQMNHAPPKSNVEYHIAAETVAQVPAHSVDLITVAQAVHWFNRDAFYAEVRRVAKPGAVLALWCYSLMEVNAEIDVLLRKFYSNVLGSYWDAERRLVDEHYQTIEFPFHELNAPPMAIQLSWTCSDFEGYLNTWSAVQHYIQANHHNPVDEFILQVRPLWTDTKPVQFPIYMRVGRVES